MTDIAPIREIAGKTIATATLHVSDLHGTEVILNFTDGTAFSLLIGARQVATMRHYEIESDAVLYEISDPTT